MANVKYQAPISATGGPITVPLAGFSNPKYIDPVSVDNATGFSIVDCASIAVMVDSFGAATITAEQTLDPDGLTGWFAVVGKPVNSATAAMSSTINALTPYVFGALGERMRLRVTVLTGANLAVRVVRGYINTDFATSVLAGTLTGASGAIDAAFGAAPLAITLRAANANPAAMSANADAVGPLATMIGAMVQKPFAIPEADWQFACAAGGIITTADVAAKAAAAAGIRNYVTGIQLCNRNAVATEFVIKDGSTVIWRTQLPANMADSMAVAFQTPLKGTAATAINVACLTTAAQVFASLQGFIAP